MSDFLQLPYNPENYEKDYAYLKNAQDSYIKNFIKSRYSRNKEYIEVIPNLLTSTFIRKQSNIYSNKVDYPEWKESKLKMLKKRNSALTMLEQYTNLNKQAVLWIYKDVDWKFKALQARDFIFLSDESIIVRTGSKLVTTTNMSSETWYIFKLWQEGKVYKCTAKSWETMPLTVNSENVIDSNTVWVEDSSYTHFPFTKTGIDLALPQTSYLPNIENIKAGGVGWGEIAAQRAFLSVLYGVTSLNSSEWEEINKAIGLFKTVNLVSQPQESQPSLNSLKLGDGKTQKEWLDIIQETLKGLAFSEGVDAAGWLSEINAGQSGKARELEMAQMIDIRNIKITEWEDFEDRNQDLMIKLGVVQVKSEVIYSPLSSRTTETEKLENEKKRIENILARYKSGSITNVIKVSELEKISLEDAAIRIKEIEKERGSLDIVEGIE